METVTNYDDGRWQGHAAEYVSVHFKRTKHKSPSVELKVRMALASNQTSRKVKHLLKRSLSGQTADIANKYRCY